MKELLLILGICMIFFLASGQNKIYTRSGFGLSAAKTFFEEYDSYSDNLIHANLNGGFNLKIGKKNALQTELQFSRKGYVYKVFNFFDEEKIFPKMEIYYASLNGLLKTEILFAKKRKTYGPWLSVLSGFQLSRNIYSKWRYANIIERKADDTIKPFDFSVIAGICLDKRIDNRQHVGFDLRYTHGLYNVVSQRGFKTQLRSIDFGFYYYWILKNRNLKK